MGIAVFSVLNQPLSRVMHGENVKTSMNEDVENFINCSNGEADWSLSQLCRAFLISGDIKYLRAFQVLANQVLFRLTHGYTDKHIEQEGVMLASIVPKERAIAHEVGSDAR